MITLDKEQVKRLHKKILDATGGSDGLRDEGMLDSALSVAFQTFDGIELYPSTAAKISRIAYGLVCNHPFVDGNKRIGTCGWKNERQAVARFDIGKFKVT